LETELVEIPLDLVYDPVPATLVSPTFDEFLDRETHQIVRLATLRILEKSS
jgi:hypothetical protein